MTVVVVAAEAPTPLREATGLLVEPVMSSLAFLCVIHDIMNYQFNSNHIKLITLVVRKLVP